MGAAHVLEDGVDGKGVAPDDLGRQVLQDGDGLHAAVDTFANAGDAGVGLDLDPQMHPVAAGWRRS